MIYNSYRLDEKNSPARLVAIMIEHHDELIGRRLVEPAHRLQHASRATLGEFRWRPSRHGSARDVALVVR